LIHSYYTCSRSSFEQRQQIPNAADQTKQQTDHTNNQRKLPCMLMSNYVVCSIVLGELRGTLRTAGAHANQLGKQTRSTKVTPWQQAATRQEAVTGHGPICTLQATVLRHMLVQALSDEEHFAQKNSPRQVHMQTTWMSSDTYTSHISIFWEC
jgi:hypothetical protein